MKKLFGRLAKSLKKISAIDRFLILFMIILLAQSAHSLFFASAAGKYTSTIDTIVRTSAAAVFGYFLSGNFISRCSEDTRVHEKDRNTVKSSRSAARCERIQVIVVSAIGVTSLLILLIFRNLAINSPDSAATVSQLRDFVSSCVGFLVSSGKKE